MERVLVSSRLNVARAPRRLARLLLSVVLVLVTIQTWPVTPVAAADVEITPNPHDFGSVAIGADGVEQVFTLTNNLSPSSLTVGTPAITSGHTGDFAVTRDLCTNRTIPIGGNCTFTVRFRPTATGPRTAIVSIESTASTYTATLTGTGTIAPALAVTPDTLPFGDQAVGTTSAAQTVTVSNEGATAIQFGTTSISGPGFSTTNDLCATTLIQPDTTCTIGVTFTPATPGPASGTLTIASDAPDSPHTVSLSGTGTTPPAGTIALADHTFPAQTVNTTSAGQAFTVTASGGPVAIAAITIADAGATHGIAVVPGSIDFGTQAAGTPSTPTEIQVINAESAVLTLGSLSLGGANPGDYLLVGDSCSGAVLLPGASCSTGVIFLPSGGAASEATILIPHSVGPEPYAIGLGGNGGIAADGGSVDPATRPEFALLADGCTGTPLATGQECSFTVTFTPAQGEQRATTLTVSSTASGGPLTIALDGEGVVNETPLTVFTPLLIDFGAQNLGGTAASQAVTLVNAGGAPLQISGVSPGGGSASDFAIVPDGDLCGGTTLLPGQACEVAVTFSPTTTGQRNASLVFTDNSPAGQRLIALAGVGTVASVPAITLSDTDLDFGEQQTGTQSASQTVTVTSTGTAALHVGAVTISGLPFVLVGNTCTAPLAPSETCAIEVRFDPIATGMAIGTLTIGSNAADSPHTVSLSGTGIAPPAPGVILSTTGLSFGDQQTGTTSAARPVTLTNSGTAPLAIGEIAASGDFAQTNDCPSTLAASAGCTISVTFAPATTGERTGTLTITSNAASSPDSIPLDGSGSAPPTPVLALSTTSLDFGNQQTGTISAAQRVTVTNTGDGQLTLGTPTLSGAVGQFSIAENGCLGASLSRDETCYLDLTFAPTGTGPQSATLTLPSNAASTPDGVALSGMGTAPAFSVTPNPLDFGSQPLGTTSAARTVTVTNTGFGPVAPGAGTADGTGFAIVTDGCASATLTPQQTCAITLTFAPTTPGPASGTLTVGSQSIALTGSGSDAPIATTLGVTSDGGTYGGTVTLRATLRNSVTTAPVAGKAITFAFGGSALGSATTDTNGVATLADVALGTRAAGTYANLIGAGFAGDGGALPSTGTATLTVTRATLTIAAESQSRAYGFANPALTVRYTGFVNDESETALRGRPAVGTTATPTSTVGNYPITVAQNTLRSDNYAFTFSNNTLTITPTPLTIAAADKSRAYGAANPTLTVRYSGFRQGDDASDLSGTLSLTTPATAASPAGTYPIEVAQGTLASPNYTFTFVNGTLTISPANVALSAVSGAATYGGTATLTATLRRAGGDRPPIIGVSIAFTLGGTAVGSATTDANGVATLAGVALGNRGAGNYAGLIDATFAGDPSQASDAATGTLRVAKAALVLRAVDQTRAVGQDNPPCRVQLAPGATFVNGDTLASLDLSDLACNYGGANRRASAGTYTITPRAVRSDNYAITYQTGTLTVTP